jgi:predicted MFS family arabinose efflux permease
VSLAVCADLVPEPQRGQASSIVLGGLMVGTVAGLADRWTISVQVGGLTVLIVFMVTFALGAQNAAVAVVALCAVGCTGVSLNPAMVTRVMRVAGGRPPVNSVHTSVINVGILLGSWIGGLSISAGLGLTSPLWVGAVLGALALVSLLPVLDRSAHGAAPVA